MSLNKILFSIYTGEYPNQFAGGPNNIIYKLIQNYNNLDFQFDYLSSDLFAEELTSNNLPELRRKLSPKKKTTSFLSEKSAIYRKFFGSDFYLPYHFYKKNKHYKSFSERKSEYSIIHSQDSISLSLISNISTSAKKIMTVHSKGPLSDELRNMSDNKKFNNNIDKKLKAIEFCNIELADLITFPSFAARKYFENSLNISLRNEKTKIVYNGIELNRIQKIEDNGILDKYKIEKKRGRLILLNVAANTPEKNLDILLKVVKILKFKFRMDILLLNVGVEREGNSKLNAHIEEFDIRENVSFLGKIPNIDVIKLLKATDIFIMTSEKVIFDLVVLEALACGTCCVVSNEGGNKEIIEDGRNGYLIEITDVEKIAKKINIINIEKVKTNAIETAKQFSVQKMVYEYFDLYESLLNEM